LRRINGPDAAPCWGERPLKSFGWTPVSGLADLPDVMFQGCNIYSHIRLEKDHATTCNLCRL